MRIIFLAAVFALTSCTSSPRKPASDKPAGKPDYLALLGNKFFEGPEMVKPEGSDRAAKVFLPKDYASKDKWPLVLLLHGYTSFSDEMNFILGLGSRVTEKGYVLLTPDGLKNSKGDRFWNATDFCCDLEKSGVDDVGYLLGLVENVASSYKIDRDRIYLYGHSNGGFMGNRLLCETENTFAGMVNLAGATFKDPKMCKVKKPVSYLQIHAVDDPTVKFEANELHAGGKNSAEQRAIAASCAPNPVKGARRDQVFLIPFRDTTPYAWQGCAKGKEVVLWEIEASTVANHKPHLPGFWWPAHVDQTLNFLFKHQR